MVQCIVPINKKTGTQRSSFSFILQFSELCDIEYMYYQLKAQWAQPVLLTFHSVLRKLYTEPSIGRVLPTKFRFVWLLGFRANQRRRIFRYNQKKELPMVAMLVNRSGQNEQSLQRTVTFHRCFLPSFGLFGQTVSEEKIFQKSTNQKEELSVPAMLVNGSGRNEQSL